MKTLFKIFLILALLGFIGVVGAYVVITNPGLQKRFIEERLPEGSSIQSVKVTLSSVQLEGLMVLLADGTEVNLRDLETKISPFAAVFDQTIKIGALRVQGLTIDMPGTLVAKTSESTPTNEGRKPAAKGGSISKVPAEAVEERVVRANPLKPVYDLARLAWRIDTERIDVDGRIRDAAGNEFSFALNADPIKPGQASELSAKASLVSRQSFPGGLQTLEGSVSAALGQNADGGFDFVGIDSELAGTNAAGARVLRVSSGVELAIDGLGERSDLTLSFAADLAKPELLAPQMEVLGAVNLEGRINAVTEGAVTRLTTADAWISVAADKVLEIALEESLILGAEQAYAGDLLRIKLSEVPLNWINPFLNQELTLEGGPLTASFVIAGEPEGALRIRPLEAVVAGPFDFSRGEERLIEQLSLTLRPELVIRPRSSLDLNLKEVSLADRYGEVAAVDGTASIQMVERSRKNPFAGVQADLSVEADAGSLLQQPALSARNNLLGGTLRTDIKLDGAADYPLRVDGALTQLRTPGAPAGRDYRFAAQTTRREGGRWLLNANLEAGPLARPSTKAGVAGFLAPESEPLAFEMDLIGERVRQSDLVLLAEAFAREEGTTQERRPRVLETPSEPGASVVGSTSTNTDGGGIPPWAGFNGTASIELDEIRLISGQKILDLRGSAVVDQRRFEVKQISAEIESGRFNGSGAVAFQPARDEPYALEAFFEFSDVNPAFFARPGERIPVQGNFSGSLTAEGKGADLESALDAAEGKLVINGRDGVLTAFEIEGKVRAALIGTRALGVLSSALLEDDSYASMSQAVTRVIPYFKNIRFNEFVLELNRGSDRRIMIPQLKVAGDNVLIDASGSVAARNLSEAFNQPLNLNLALGSKGRLADHLERLRLLEPTEEPTGNYRIWTKGLTIGGTLADPDTRAIRELLLTAAKKNLREGASVRQSKSKGSDGGTVGNGGQNPTAEEPNRRKTKEQQLIEEIGAGLQLLDSVLGN